MAKRLQTLIELLAKKYETEGRKGELTDLRDPFQVGCWQILGEHSKKNGQQRSYEALRRAKGITPGQLLDSLPEKLNSIAQQAGPYEDARAKRLYQFADDIEDKCGQNFAKIFEKPLKDARAFLEKRTAADTAAFAGSHLLMSAAGYPVFALDFKIVRAAARLGYTKVQIRGRISRRPTGDVQKNFEPELVKKDPEWSIRAFGLLHRLGHDLCIAGVPRCPSLSAQQRVRPIRKSIRKFSNVPEPTESYVKAVAAG